jgi:hypothetical protein
MQVLTVGAGSRNGEEASDAADHDQAAARGAQVRQEGLRQPQGAPYILQDTTEHQADPHAQVIQSLELMRTTL